MTLELQLFPYLAGYAEYVWEIVIFLLFLYKARADKIL